MEKSTLKTSYIDHTINERAKTEHHPLSWAVMKTSNSLQKQEVFLWGYIFSSTAVTAVPSTS
jgi:hypothetical protein